ncbi:MAG: prepilin-type N-terminal cleavage/methylation domain-containing protein [Mariprofundales bacterium]|nr:prepilin-type N-terminal cleavage/methylation domain-containing protein [Mariprofundales bacterium]
MVAAGASLKVVTPRSGSAGFTLMEIVLVIVIISVVTALVVPSLLSSSVDSAVDETHKLQQVLRLAVDEAQLTGVPLRWWARAHSYGFEKLVEREWQPVQSGVFAPHKMVGVVIDRVVENGVEQQIEEGDSVEFARSDRAVEPLIGRVVILPNGMVTAVDLDLLSASGELHRLAVRPGAAGVVEERLQQGGG